jgi:hypothetical protein
MTESDPGIYKVALLAGRYKNKLNSTGDIYYCENAVSSHRATGAYYFLKKMV